jgi:anti-anti-sigma regulatory factor
MPFSIATAQGRQTLKLAGQITIRDAHDLATGLREGLDHSSPVEVDTRSLEDIDTCILQLLYSLRKTVPALSFDNPSEVLIRAVNRSGLHRELLGAREDL